jgi:hypothetical protein
MEGEGGLFGKGLAASGQEDGGQERVKLKGWIWSKYVICMHETLTVKPIIFAQLIYANFWNKLIL